MKSNCRNFVSVLSLAFILATLNAFAQAPVITVLGKNPVTNECFTPFNDPGAVAHNVIVPLAGGYHYSAVLRSDGTVRAWGYNSDGECNVPAGATNVIVISGSNYHNLALKSDGTVVAWGNNYYGQINVPADATNAIAIAAGGWHSMVLRNDGSVLAWGFNNFGECNVPASATNVIAIAAGYRHSLALKMDGTVLAWGENSNGECNVPASASNIVAIAAGWHHNLALKTDGTVLAWGYNSDGECNVPADATNIVAIAAGGNHSLALRSDGTVIAWGDNSYGQTNVPASATNIIAIAAGYWHSLALRSDGTVVAWGYNNYGQSTVPDGLIGNTSGRVIRRTAFNPNVLGTQTIYYTVAGAFGGTSTASRTVVVQDTTPPVLTITGANPLLLQCPGDDVSTGITATDLCAPGSVASIAAGVLDSVALKNNGSVIVWGYNGWGETNVPANATNVVAIAGNCTHHLALRHDGTVIGWGNNDHGQITIPTAATNIVAIAAGWYHSLGLCSDGTVLGWGYGNVPAGATNVAAIAAGTYHALALQSDGTVIGWGMDGSFGETNTPASATNIVAIAAGLRFSLALKSDGSVVGWGSNSNGQTTIPASATNVVAIAAGWYHGLALRSDGTVVGWGYDFYGQTNTPSSATNIVAIAAGDMHNIALRSDGEIISWGANNYGQTIIPINLTDAITNITITGTVGYGTNTLTYAAVDPSGNTGIVQRTVIVADTTPPTITCPTNIFASAVNASGAVVTFSTPVAIDNCTGAVDVVCSPVSGSTFPIGTNTVNVTATDASGNTNSCSFTITVADSTPPTITAPADKTVPTDLDQCSATGIDLGTPTTDDNVGIASVTNNAPASYSLGTNQVIWTAYDAAGNSTTATQQVVVLDLQAPTITCPSNIVAAATTANGAVVTFDTPIATDNCTGTVNVICSPSSGSTFPIGTNTVTVTATDASGNTNTCSFTVIVLTVPITITKQQAKVNFIKPLSDSTSFTANIGLPDDFAPSNKVVTVDIAGVSTDFTLDYKGKSKLLTGSSCALKKNKLGGWIITVKLAKADYAASWSDNGFTNETIADKPVTLPVTITANGQVFTGFKSMLYKATQNGSGAAK